MNIDVDRSSRKVRFDLHSSIDKSSIFVRKKCSHRLSKERTVFRDDTNYIETTVDVERSVRTPECVTVDVNARRNAAEIKKSVDKAFPNSRKDLTDRSCSGSTTRSRDESRIDRQDQHKSLSKRSRSTRTTSLFIDKLKSDFQRADDIVKKIRAQRNWCPKFVTKYFQRTIRTEPEEPSDTPKKSFSKRSVPDVPRIYSIGLHSRLKMIEPDRNEDSTSFSNLKRHLAIARYQKVSKFHEDGQSDNWQRSSLPCVRCIDFSDEKHVLPLYAASYLLKTDDSKNERTLLSNEHGCLREDSKENGDSLRISLDLPEDEAKPLTEAEVHLRSMLPNRRSPRKRSHRHRDRRENRRRRKLDSHCGSDRSHRNCRSKEGERFASRYVNRVPEEIPCIYTDSTIYNDRIEGSLISRVIGNDDTSRKYHEPKFGPRLEENLLENSSKERSAGFRLDRKIGRGPWKVRSMKKGADGLSCDSLKNDVKIRPQFVRNVKSDALFRKSHVDDEERSQAYKDRYVVDLEETRQHIRRRSSNDNPTVKGSLLEHNHEVKADLRGRISEARVTETKILEDIKRRIDEDFDPDFVKAKHVEMFKVEESTFRVRLQDDPEENVVLRVKLSNDFVESVDSGVLMDFSRHDLLRCESDSTTSIMKNDDEVLEGKNVERRDALREDDDDDFLIERVERAVKKFTEKLIACERRTRIGDRQKMKDRSERSRRSVKRTFSSRGTRTLDWSKTEHSSPQSTESTRSICDFSKTSQWSSDEERIADISTPSLLSLSDSEVDKPQSLADGAR